MPVTGGSDNILATYDMDTVGDIRATTISRIVVEDTGIDNEEVITDIKETPGAQPQLTEWGKNYPNQQIVDFAKTLMGTPYLYGSTNPSEGFDCSGFISYVFNHFGLKVPRSSVEFTNRGREVPVARAQPGDLILFTGTDSTDRTVGHMGIVIEKNSDGGLQFIHSSSGKANGVTVSPLEGYYEKRFVKVISVKEGI